LARGAEDWRLKKDVRPCLGEEEEEKEGKRRGRKEKCLCKIDIATCKMV